jgi:hypothetical protein
MKMVVEEKKPKELPEDVRPQVPAIEDILTETEEETSPVESAVAATQAIQPKSEEDILTTITMQYLFKRDKEKTKLVKETLKVLPELAKSDNPLVAIMLEKLMTSGGSSNDLTELKELAKAMSYTIILPELMKDVARTIKGTGDSNEAISLLLQALEERDRRLQDLIQQIKEEKENEALKQLREEFYNAMNTLVETFGKTIEEMKSQIQAVAEMAVQGGRNASASDPLSELERLETWINKSSAVLQKLGFKVISPDDLMEKMKEAGQLDLEKELKLKELELKKKEIEAKQEFYNRLADILGQLAQNPDTIIRLIDGIIGIFKGGGTPTKVAGAMKSTGTITTSISVERAKSVPSLTDFVGGE